jgi:hypothetical protein
MCETPVQPIAMLDSGVQSTLEVWFERLLMMPLYGWRPMTLNRIWLPLTFFLLLVPAHGLTDTIWLKSGKKIEAEKTWQKGSNVQFIMHGLVVNVAIKDILRIEKEPQADSQEASASESPPSSGSTARVQTPVSPGSSAGAAPGLLERRPSAFRGLFWGESLTGMNGMRPAGSALVYGGITEYRRSYDPLMMGQAELESIRYGFRRGQLATITIWTRGKANYNALAQEAETLFGAGRKIRKKRTYTIWSNRDSSRMLVYYKSRGRGLLWMQAAQLDGMP